MRIWSLHPRYLDRQGLTALWRETLLAQKVLLGETKGYRHHPQLERFRATADPAATVGAYLREVVREAERRGYSFDASKIVREAPVQLPVTAGQLEYEWTHLLAKLKARSPQVYAAVAEITAPETHPLFHVVPGGVEGWERR